MVYLCMPQSMRPKDVVLQILGVDIASQVLGILGAISFSLTSTESNLFTTIVLIAVCSVMIYKACRYRLDIDKMSARGSLASDTFCYRICRL